MKRILATGLIALTIIACSGGNNGDPSDGEVSREAELLAQEALHAMLGASAYEAAVTLPVNEPDNAQTSIHWKIEYQQPDNYRFFIFFPEGESEQVCDERTLPEGGFSSSCRTVWKTITGESVLEAVLLDDQMFIRSCKAVDESCDVWEIEERPDVPAFGLSTLFVPGWPLVAIELMDDWGAADGDMTALRGSVNLPLAVIENIRRLADAAGWSEDEFRDFVGLESDDDLASLDDGPDVDILVVLTPNQMIREVEFGGASGLGDVLIEYSRFDEIIIEAPQ